PVAVYERDDGRRDQTLGLGPGAVPKARVGREVGDDHRLARGGRRPDQALARSEPVEVSGVVVAKPHAGDLVEGLVTLRLLPEPPGGARDEDPGRLEDVAGRGPRVAARSRAFSTAMAAEAANSATSSRSDSVNGRRPASLTARAPITRSPWRSGSAMTAVVSAPSTRMGAAPTRADRSVTMSPLPRAIAIPAAPSPRRRRTLPI